MLNQFLGACALVLFFFASAFAEEVTLEGTVKLPGGKPVARALITLESTEIFARTDDRGAYTLKIPRGTFIILVEAVGYELHAETVSTGEQSLLHLDFVLQPRSLQFEEIVVGAREAATAVSISSPTSSIEPAAQAKSTSVLAAVTDIPGVAPLGQGGLFQVPSIRGASRERTLMMLESVRVTSERRTGPSFSFVDPLMLERLHITRGPAPVLYGSNGETGLIQATVLEPIVGKLNVSFRTGYLTNSRENWQTLTLKNGTNRFQYALGTARREGNDYVSGDGQRYPAGYERFNVFGKARWLTDDGALSVLVLPSWTNDIDKASSDASTRPTLYPKERHQVYLADWQNHFSEESFNYQVQGWLHPNSLITQDERVTNDVVTSRNVVFNDTNDYGIRFRIGHGFSETWNLWTGLDLFGRADINARQESYVPSASGSGFDLVDSFYSIKDGSYTDAGVFLTANGNLGRMLSNAGLRIQRVRVSNHAAGEVTDSENSWSGNAGISYPMFSQWDAVFNLGRGIRPATISEKFFTGETGRGSITGNPNLVTESNLEIDGGIRFHRENTSAGFYLFRNNIKNFIARVRVEGDAFTYFNLPEVTIHGFEGEGFYAWKNFRFYGNFHYIKGHDSLGADVNDIPPSRLIAGIEYQPAGRFSGSVEFVQQFKKSDPGPDELARDAAFVVNVKAQVTLIDHLQLRAEALNLGNETYYDSADNRAPLAIGRSLGVELLVDF